MPNRLDQYYVGDIITFKGVFKIAGVEQTPDAASGKVQIWKVGSTEATLAETTASISATQLQYKHTPAAAGQYALYFYCTFNSGADKRSGVIEFIVRVKEAH